MINYFTYFTFQRHTSRESVPSDSDWGGVLILVLMKNNDINFENLKGRSKGLGLFVGHDWCLSTPFSLSPSLTLQTRSFSGSYRYPFLFQLHQHYHKAPSLLPLDRLSQSRGGRMYPGKIADGLAGLAGGTGEISQGHVVAGGLGLHFWLFMLLLGGWH